MQVESELPLENQWLNTIGANEIKPFARKQALVAA